MCMYKSLWLKNNNSFKAIGSVCSLWLFLISFGVQAQLPQQWHLGSGKLIDFTQEPPVIKQSEIDLSKSNPNVFHPPNLLHFGDSMFVKDILKWSISSNGALNVDSIKFNHTPLRTEAINTLDILDSFVIFRTRVDSVLILYNAYSKKEWVISLNHYFTNSSFLFYQERLNVLVSSYNKNLIYVYQLNKGLLQVTDTLSYATELGWSKEKKKRF